MPLTNIDPNLTSQMTTNLTSAFIPTMNNSINLTGEITTTLVQPLILYTTAINASAAVAGGLIGGAIALIGVWITQKHSDEREERNRMEDSRKRSREERKEVYVRFTAYMNKLLMVSSMSPQGLANSNVSIVGEIVIQFAQYWSEISLIDPQLTTEIAEIMVSMSKIKSGNEVEVISNIHKQYSARILPLMQDDLASPSSPEEPSIKHWWQFRR